jgi:uncharacterized damage-inducible protein DinB
MPDMDVLTEFFQHNAMMNLRLLDTCRQLTSDQLGATAVGTYGGIGATLVHIANSQEGYAARLLNDQRPPLLEDDPFPGFEALVERFTRGNSRLEEAATRTDWDREIEVTGDDPPGTWSMRVGLLLLQAINHGTEHRSQIATTLTQIGVEPPAMDGWTYFFASGHMVDV